MGIYFIEHAERRFIERNIPVNKIRKMLDEGITIDDIGEKAGRKICIYKEGNSYFTVVFQPCGEHKFIITGYPSKEWEKKICREIKR
ncbi:MAG: DUF4258 domain-containing protein [Candidatus Diapherotrites archaeon]|nr:DUF4258 domain-containing protein [Candidatus Diapherotrites archaeon]